MGKNCKQKRERNMKIAATELRQLLLAKQMGLRGRDTRTARVLTLLHRLANGMSTLATGARN